MDLGNHIALIPMDPIPNASLMKEMVTILKKIIDMATDADPISTFGNPAIKSLLDEGYDENCRLCRKK